MDFGDEDLFAVFDSESTKSKRSAVASETLDDDSAAAENEQNERPVKFDAGVLAAEITPSKRSKSDDDEEEPVKKIKRDDTRNENGC